MIKNHLEDCKHFVYTKNNLTYEESIYIGIHIYDSNEHDIIISIQIDFIK